MVASVVDRATSSMLIGPDWAINMEICDMLNRDPGQVKDVVKGLKRRMGNKKPKVQLLTLMLLETIMKNCGDIVHMNVADKGLPREMVKMIKKKPDYQVKEKILVLIDTWQDAFGGPRARYSQYFAAYQDLLHAGASFPHRSERGAPVSTPAQSHALSSYSHGMQNSEYKQESYKAGSSTEGELSSLSLSEIQKVRGSVDLLSEMLSAVKHGNKEALRQEALVDLVEQCRTCKPRVVHLVNSTADESLLCQGLALHDDLQRVLVKYDTVLSGVNVQVERPKRDLIPQDRGIVESHHHVDAVESSRYANGRSEASIVTQLPVSTLPATNNTPTPPKIEVKMDLINCDLLGGDDYSSLTQNSLALVPISAPQPSSPVASDNNALALVDLLSMGSNPSNGEPALSHHSQQQQQQHLHPQQQGQMYQNGTTPNMTLLNEQSGYQQNPGFSWSAQSVHHQQQQPPIYQNGITSNMESPHEQSWGAQSTQLQQQQQQPPSPVQQNGMTPSMGSAHEQSYPQISGSPWGTQSSQLQQQSPSPLQQNGMISSVHEQSYPQISGSPWGSQTGQLQQKPSSPIYGNGGSMPPPPWESQSNEIQPFGTPFSSTMLISKMGGNPQSPRIQTFGLPSTGNDQQIVGMFVQPITSSQLMALNQNFQMPTIYTQPMQGSQMMGMLTQAMQGNQMNPMHHSQQIYGYGSYGQQDTQYLEQGMYGLSLKDESTALSLTSNTPNQLAMTTYLPPVKQQPKAAGDLLFGDLVDLVKVKPAKASPGGAGAM